MNRKQCEITDPEKIKAVLDAATIGRMATIDGAGYPYITPVNFVYHQGCVYFHCALKGEKLDNIAANTKVCFEVDIPLAYLDAGFTDYTSPCNLHQFYHCVIIRGRAAVVADGQLKLDALNALVAKHEKGHDIGLVHADMPDYRTCRVVEIRPERVTAKSDLAQGKTDATRLAIARHFKARGASTDRDTIQAFGLDPVIQKPFSMQNLASKVREVLDQVKTETKQ